MEWKAHSPVLVEEIRGHARTTAQGGRKSWKFSRRSRTRAKTCGLIATAASIRPRVKLLVMRSQSYGDKQREAQRRKKQEELWKKSNPERALTPEVPTNPDNSDQTPNKAKKEDTPGKRSA